MAEHIDVLHAIRACSVQGQQAEAASLAIREYGPEMLDFLTALHRDETQSADVFCLWAEGVWRSLASFSWQGCSLRTWLYAVARLSSLRYRRDLRRQRARVISVPEVASVLDRAAELRSSTPWYAKSELSSRFVALRSQLEPDDQLMLLLRVERRLSWNEVARVMLEGAPDGTPSEGELAHAVVRLRKRFQTVKERLLDLGRQQGLIDTRAPKRASSVRP
jgi:RNA polymerase sigma-70 factor (ECF subfamily)